LKAEPRHYKPENVTLQGDDFVVRLDGGASGFVWRFVEAVDEFGEFAELS
jgi:hypothetical protein